MFLSGPSASLERGAGAITAQAVRRPNGGSGSTGAQLSKPFDLLVSQFSSMLSHGGSRSGNSSNVPTYDQKHVTFLQKHKFGQVTNRMQGLWRGFGSGESSKRDMFLAEEERLLVVILGGQTNVYRFFLL